MELKFLWQTNRALLLTQVLIVPLWNRNVGTELILNNGPSSNRTFMELKYVYVMTVFVCDDVLIVPLWN